MYKVEKIYDRVSAQERTDTSNKRRVGCTVFVEPKTGQPCHMWCKYDADGREGTYMGWITSAVRSFQQQNDVLVIVTQNSIYKLREVPDDSLQQ